MNERKKELDFVKQKFGEYYHNNIESIQPPKSLEKREWGFFLFKDRIMVRHRSFQSEKDFKSFLVSLTPSDLYYSSAYYVKPEEPMGKKDWLGADLIFDIDSDHIDTPCRKNHHYWVCAVCKNALIDKSLRECPLCGGSNLKEETWLCETCLEAAKAETLKLADFLIEDFGFPSEDIEICFSGQRGYHARICKTEVRQLNQAARKEIVDYVSGTGLKIELHGLKQIGSRGYLGPDLNDPGWDGRIARGVYGLLSSSSPQILEKLPKSLIDNRDYILNEWSRNVPWGIKGVGIKTWRKIIRQMIKDQAANIDTVVTIDTHRLIRLPLSLHGKTGLKAVNIPLNYLERFDPLKEAIAFKEGSLKVHVNVAHRFRIGNEEFGPFKNEDVELPMAASIYLLCKRAAVLTDH